MDEKNSAGKQLILLLVGIAMCAAGLYLFAKQVSVTPFSGGFGYFGMFGKHDVPGGLVVMPLIIGIALWVILPNSFLGKLVTSLGTLFIVIGVVSSLNLFWKETSLYELILILVLIFGGGALALRILLMPSGVDKKK